MSYPITSARSCLSRPEAKLRLSTLIPGTEEHGKLQDALIKSLGIVEISLPKATYKVNTISDNCKLQGGFGPSERIAIGKQIKLQGLLEGTLIKKRTVSIRFEHIAALGNFYGVVGQPISLLGGDDLEKIKRFENAFETILNADHHDIRKLIEEINTSTLPHHCFNVNKAIKKIKPDIDDLLTDNSDHFSTNAKEVYRIGHALAMTKAAQYGLENNEEGLKLAYAMDAYACHFLIDLFEAGHVRTERGELETFLIEQLGFSAKNAKLLAAILAEAQQEQDRMGGLNVYNKKGVYWRIIGEENRDQIIYALQQSVNEIYLAYQNPNQIISSNVDQLIPQAAFMNPAPIYSVEGTTLFMQQGCNKIAMTSKSDFLQKAISHAQRYIPKRYIDEVVSTVGFHPFKENIPFKEHITGPIWQMIGHVTCLKKTNFINETLENCCNVLKQLEKKPYSERLNCLQNIKKMIQEFQELKYQYTTFTLSKEQKKSMEQRFWNMSCSLGSLFMNETLESNFFNAQEDVNLWFRKMLSCQVGAFSLYASFYILRKGFQEIELLKKQVGEFEASVLKQIRRHKNFIDMELIYESEDYIILQSEKKRIKKLYTALSNQSK